MSNAAEAELRLKFVDKGATNGIDKVAKHVEQITRQTENRVEQSNNKQRQSYERLSLAREQLGMRSEQKIQRDIRQTEQRVDQAHNKQRQSYERLSLARERLGMRSEKTIQREIVQTEHAYKRLAASGNLTQDELTRAAEKTRQKITKLTNEMGKLTKEQEKAAKAAKDFETAQGRVRGAVAGGAGLLAGGYALKQPIMNAMSFDERVAYLSNTANNELDARGRKLGKADLEKAVNDSIKFGGTRDNSMSALEALMSSNAFTVQDAIKLLPQVIKASTATNTPASDVVQVGLAAMQNMGVSPQDLPAVFNMAAAGGQAGKFEFTDQSKFLPSQLAAAQGLGFSGRSGLASIIALNQAAATTAGNSNEAGINVENLLSKVNSEDTSKKIDKILKVDSAKYFEKRLGAGVNTIDALGELIDKNISKRSDYRDLQKQLKGAKNNTDRKSVLESMTKIAESAGIGEIIGDRQALTALLGYRNNPELVAKVLAKINANNVNSGGEVDTAFSVISDTPGFKTRELGQQVDIAQKNAMDVLTPTIGRLAEGFSDLSQRYPDFSAAVVGAMPPIIALGTAAGISAVAMGGGTGGLGGAAIGTASKLVTATSVISSAIAGFQFGSDVVKPWIDKVVQNLTDDKNATLGTAIYDKLNKPVDVNINLTTEVQDRPGFMTRQKVTKVSGGQVNHAETGNMWNGGTPR